MKKLTLALSVLSLSIASSFAQADTMSQEQKVSGFYLGGTAGQAKGIQIRDADYTTDYPRADDSESSSSENSIQVLAGYQFNRIIAIELAYTDFGSLENQYSVVAFKPTAFSGQANIGYTFHSGWRPFALVGLSYLDLKQEAQYYTDDSNPTLRTGLGVEISPRSLNGVAFRATWTQDWFATEYTVLRKTYTDTNMLGNLSVGVTYKF